MSRSPTTPVAPHAARGRATLCRALCAGLSGLAAVLLLIAPVAPAAAQLASPGELPAMNAATRAAVVESLTAAIDTVYVLEEPARRIVAGLRRNLADGAYDDITDPALLARRLYEDAQAINHDGHFRIAALPPLDPEVAAADRDEDPAEVARRARRQRARNHGFRKAEVLPGGVGYLRFDQFSHGEEAFEAATAAMNFLGNCDAVILDLRQNGGGAASMIRYLCGYLFAEDTHLINWDIRARGKTVQSYSADYVPGQRLTEQPVYILTSSSTFSAAEEFTFDLRNLGRATVVGEVTGGGGHTVAGYVFGFDGFRMGIRIPYGRAYNPLDNEGWEGVGVQPHVEVPAAKALETAYDLALKKLIEQEEDEDYRASLAWVQQDVESRANPVALSARELERYVGSYGPRRIYLEDGALHYQREDRPPYRLEPMGQDRFRVGDLDYFRLSFERDDSGRVVKVIGHYDDGRTDENPRDS